MKKRIFICIVVFVYIFSMMTGCYNPDHDGPGFNETVYWDVEWISEDEIRLYIPGYRWTNEVYYIDIPK